MPTHVALGSHCEIFIDEQLKTAASTIPARSCAPAGSARTTPSSTLQSLCAGYHGWQGQWHA